MLSNTFINKCINGSALQFEIEEYISKWHNEETGLKLNEFLGMSNMEYNAWILDDSILPFIIKAHKNNIKFEEMELSNYEQIAARNSDSREVVSLINWLKENAI